MVSGILSNRIVGADIFLEKYCPNPAALTAALHDELRVQTLYERQARCLGNEEADCLWIVEEGLLQVMVDRSTLDGLAGETRALWVETVARALVAKLDEVSLQRASQARDLDRVLGHTSPQ